MKLTISQLDFGYLVTTNGDEGVEQHAVLNVQELLTLVSDTFDATTADSPDSEFKVGDKVKTRNHGHGEVVEIHPHEEGDKHVVVYFSDLGHTREFCKGGGYVADNDELKDKSPFQLHHA